MPQSVVPTFPSAMICLEDVDALKYADVLIAHFIGIRESRNDHLDHGDLTVTQPLRARWTP